MKSKKTKNHYPFAVIGAGAGGLVIAMGLAKAGKQVLLIEKGSYGGDCTNFGCIPSKSLIASANTAFLIRQSSKFGIDLSSSTFNANGALERVRNIVATLVAQEDPEALSKHHIDILTGTASFADPHTLRIETQVEELLITVDQIIIATGSKPLIPEIPGLQNTPYHTNETIFTLDTIPESLAILGGGAIGCELGQAFQRLGAKVSLIEMGDQLLGKEEPEAARLIAGQFAKENIRLYLSHEMKEVFYDGHFFDILLQNRGVGQEKIRATNLLIAAGRSLIPIALNLAAAQVHYDKQGVSVDRFGRTSQSHIWAVGDVTGKALFTHMAENEARCVLRNLLLPWPFKKKENLQGIPRATFTDPEIASTGLNEKEAGQKYGIKNIRTYLVPFTEVDRAITLGRTEGFVKIVTKKWSSKILGATIASPHAGEMLPELLLAIQAGIPLRKLASLIHPYPTLSLAIRKAADQWLAKTILPLFFRKGKT